MAEAVAAPRSFDFGRVFSDTFSVIGKNFVTFSVLSIISSIPVFVLDWFAIGRGSLGGTKVLLPNGGSPGSYFLMFGLSGLVGFVFSCILQAALIQGTVLTLNGRRASMGDCLRTGLNTLFPVIAVALLWSIGILLGFVLLIVPGFILLVGWYVAIPVVVVEKKPIFEVFGRSWNLTSGHRWMLFGVFIVLIIVTMIISFAIRPFAGLSLGLRSATGVSVVYLAATMVQRVVTAMINSTIAGVIYFELRSIKEGIGAEELASVFD